LTNVPKADPQQTLASHSGRLLTASLIASARDRYCDMAKTLGFETHIALADAMP
jgi:hypothetical protein